MWRFFLCESAFKFITLADRKLNPPFNTFGCLGHQLNFFHLKHENLIHPRCLVKTKVHTAAPNRPPTRSTLGCVALLSNLIGIVGCDWGCHSSTLVKSPCLFCDNASCNVLVSLYWKLELRLQAEVGKRRLLLLFWTDAARLKLIKQYFLGEITYAAHLYRTLCVHI